MSISAYLHERQTLKNVTGYVFAALKNYERPNPPFFMGPSIIGAGLLSAYLHGKASLADLDAYKQLDQFHARVIEQGQSATPAQWCLAAAVCRGLALRLAEFTCWLELRKIYERP